jgi:hypothetical protein
VLRAVRFPPNTFRQLPALFLLLFLPSFFLTSNTEMIFSTALCVGGAIALLDEGVLTPLPPYLLTFF